MTYINLQKTSDGWSIPPTPDDTWYVDVNAAAGGDGTTWGTAFDTIEDACQAVVSGNSTRIVIKEGQTFSGHFKHLSGKSGKSNTEPIVIMTENWDVNGCSNGRAVFDAANSAINTADAAFFVPATTTSNVAFLGIEFTNSSFDGTFTGDRPDVFFLKNDCKFQNFLWEDCYFHDRIGFSVGTTTGPIYDADHEFRRCNFYQLYVTSNGGQGYFAVYVAGVRFYQCALIRNGWHPDNEEQNAFDRNMYISVPAERIELEEVISADTSSSDQLRAGGTIDTLLEEHTPDLMNFGFTNDSNKADESSRADGFNLRAENVICIDARAIHTSPRGLRWKIANSTDKRLSLISDFIIARDASGGGANEGGLQLFYQDDDRTSEADILDNGLHNLLIRNGIVYDVDKRALDLEFTNGTQNPPTTYASTGVVNNVVIEDCYFHARDGNIAEQQGSITSGVTLRNNQYYHTTDTESSNTFRYNGTARNFAEWKSDTGENGTWGERTFSDPTRNFPRYYREVLGYSAGADDDADRESLYLLIVQNRRYGYDTRLTTAKIYEWIRAGFDVGILSSTKHALKVSAS